MRHQREEGDERTGDVTRNSSNAQWPVDILYRQRVRRRGTLRTDDTWVGGRTRAIREGKETCRPSKSNAFDVVIGQGLLCVGWTAARFRLRCGAVWFLSNDQTDTGRGSGHIGYSRLAWFVLPFHHAPLLLQWMANGCDLRPSLVPGSYGGERGIRVSIWVH